MSSEQILHLYQELQRYVSWKEDDTRRVAAIAGLIEPYVAAIVDDFYAEIDRHADARKVITGGAEQVAQLKLTLRGWLRDLVSGQYDMEYVARRWRVGMRHVEIGLSQVFANAALSRLRRGLLQALHRAWSGAPSELAATCTSLNLLLDLDMAIIEDAYQTEYSRRQQQSDRLAAIGQIAGGVAHELRNPLNVIQSSVYFLLHTHAPSPEKTRRHLERIERQVNQADQIITALADFARLPAPDAQAVAVQDCLREVLELNPLPAAIEVALHCPEALPPVLGDFRQLKIVFGNLVRNARDAMLLAGGALTITAELVEPDVAIIVADTGSGIRGEDLQRIMEPLYSTKARGIGLGLAIARSIVEKHGGRLLVSSELGVGSRFTVCLPSAPRQPNA